MEEKLETFFFSVGDILSSLDFMRMDEQEVERFISVLANHDEVYTTGVGKAGLVAKYFADLLTSTGTPAHFIDPANATHGDLGRIFYAAPIVVFSASGATEELINFLDEVKWRNHIMFVTCQSTFPLKEDYSEISIDCGPIHEGNRLGFPGGSQVAMTLFCAAAASELVERKDVTQKEYADLHPGGQIGARLSRLRQTRPYSTSH